MSALALIDLTKSYTGAATLKGIDLALDEGEFLVLLGPSGCGKSRSSTSSRMLERPRATCASPGGPSLAFIPRTATSRWSFQSYALYPNLTVAGTIGFGLEMRGVAKAVRDAAVARVAETLQITPLLDRRPRPIVGGPAPARRHRARRWCAIPAIFLFDETAFEPRRQARASRRAPRSSGCTRRWARRRSTSHMTRSRP